jgi:hypothetical protein
MKTKEKSKLTELSNPIEIKKSVGGTISGKYPVDLAKAEVQGFTFNQVDYVHACLIYGKC